MKNLLIICLLAQAFLFVSCQGDESENMILPENFVGIWEIAVLDCTGSIDDEAEYIGQAIVITEDKESDDLLVDFGDDTIFKAYVESDQLIINTQTINEGGEFDVVTLSAVAEMNDDDSVEMEFTHNVDDEGVSNCVMILQK